MGARNRISVLRMKLLLVLMFVFLGVSVQAQLYILSKITSSSGGDDGQFTMEVLPADTSQVEITFTNDCTTDGVITNLYMNENELMAFNAITYESEGVHFSLNDKNAMLPGGNSLGFTPQTTFSVKADPAGPKNGLASGDSITLLFDLLGDTTFDDIIASINHQTLGIGIHAQALPGGVSGSFVAVPEPVTLALLGLGTLLIRHKKRGTAH